MLVSYNTTTTQEKNNLENLYIASLDPNSGKVNGSPGEMPWNQ